MTTIGYTGHFVTYTAKSTGTYDIVAYGAQGGGQRGGLGAEIGGDVTLTAGETLTIAVGGMGVYSRGGGGGGGTFVIAPGNAPLVIAGGGGGSSGYFAGSPGLTGTAGGAGGYGGKGGTNGSGGRTTGYSGGGGGFIGSGQSGNYRGDSGGASFAAGLAGGIGTYGGLKASHAGTGGFGGGGGGYDIFGGGGGGYSGGGAGGKEVSILARFTGGGGGSFDGGTNQVLVAGENSGNGLVVITPLSVAPVISGTAANQPATDQAPVSLFAHVTVTEISANAPTETAGINFTAANGTLSDPNAATDGGHSFNGGYSVTGSAAAVTAALDGLVFTPTAHQVAPGQSVTTSFTLYVQNADNAIALDTATSVVATAVASPITATPTTETVATTDAKAAIPFSGVVITDPNFGQSETAVVSLSAANGTLSDPNAAADGSTTSGGVITITGSASAVATDLDGLVLTPTAHEVAPGSVVSTTVTAAITDTAGQKTSIASTVNATAVASPVTATPATETVATTDEKAASPFSAVAITDPNFGQTETAVVSLSAAANGTLSDPNAATDGSTTSGGSITVTGSASAVAADLDGLVFTPTAHQVAPGSVVSTTVSAAISDTAGQTTSIASTVTATAVNDAPVIGGTKSGQATQDTAAIEPFATASVTDVDSGVQDSLAIVLDGAGAATDANGTLSGAGLTKTGTGAYSLAAAAPATLTAELQALSFTPTAHQTAAGTTVTTTFALTASQTAGGTTTTAANAATSVVATETQLYNVINGPQGGFAIIQGTAGADQITAYGSFNAIFGNGGNDLINAGNGNAVVTLGDGNATVTLGGGYNAVLGGAGNTTVTGAPGGNTAVTLGDGNATVKIGGTHDIILLGAGTDVVSGTQGMAFISTGAGNDTITLGGAGSTVNAGGGTNSITGGTGGDTFVLPAVGRGFDSIRGFTETNGDVLDLRAALAATSWNHQAGTLGNYLKVTDSGGSATLSIAPKGSGAATAIALLNGSGNLGLADLVSHHSLLT